MRGERKRGKEEKKRGKEGKQQREVKGQGEKKDV